MKKLFFLCAFLFMSMQIQAQVYIVIIKQEAIDQPLFQTVISPNGDVSDSIIEISASDEADRNNLVFSDVGLGKAMREVSATLNEIIAKGYTLLSMPLPYEPTSHRSGSIRAVYYLTK